MECCDFSVATFSILIFGFAPTQFFVNLILYRTDLCRDCSYLHLYHRCGKTSWVFVGFVPPLFIFLFSSHRWLQIVSVRCEVRTYCASRNLWRGYGGRKCSKWTYGNYYSWSSVCTIYSIPTFCSCLLIFACELWSPSFCGSCKHSSIVEICLSPSILWVSFLEKKFYWKPKICDLAISTNSRILTFIGGIWIQNKCVSIKGTEVW